MLKNSLRGKKGITSISIILSFYKMCLVMHANIEWVKYQLTISSEHVILIMLVQSSLEE